MNFPSALYIDKSSVEIYTQETLGEMNADPRGILWMFEPPDSRAHYIMGLDSTEGITGWTRGSRIESDHKVDNGAIVVLKVGGARKALYKKENGVLVPDIDPDTKRQRVISIDVQVAEYAAPVDAVEIARVASVIGRIYCGDAEEQCELIWEAWPGCGMMCTQELLKLGYTNLWHWEHIDSTAEITDRLGWRSSYESLKLLWYRSRRHIMNRQLRVRSTALKDEFSNAEIDIQKMRARAAYGFHDDRFMACNLAIWGGNKWTYDPEQDHVEVRTSPTMDFQSYAPTLDDEHQTFAEWRQSATDDWLD